MKVHTALILMSTYQGDNYLAEQLDSIIAQTHQDWVLLIRDDGSTDRTLDIIHQYQKRDARIILTQDNRGNLKPAQSFSVLMERALERNEPYIFFSDQDDIWMPQKLALFIDKFEQLNNQHDSKTPLLVFSDLCVVDEKLKIIHPSYLQYEKLIPQIESPIHTLLVHNFVTGCAMGMNRALLKIATPTPVDAIMHDWWCALCVAATGKMDFIRTATVLYRQHSQNDTGSKGFYGKIFPLNQLRHKSQQYNKRFLLRFAQAEQLAERTEKRNRYSILLNQFIALPKENRAQRLSTMNTLQLLPAGIARKMWFYFYLITA